MDTSDGRPPADAPLACTCDACVDAEWLGEAANDWDGWDDWGPDPDEELDHEHADSYYLKYWFDGARSATDLARWLRQFADELDGRCRAGWRLAGEVSGGWVHLVQDGVPDDRAS